MSERPRIVEAMEEVSWLRDSGHPVQLAIAEVAVEFRVSEAELRRRAEQSWGSPLEQDRERNSAHFEFVERKSEIANRARIATRKLWDIAWPVYSRESDLMNFCERKFVEALERSNVDHLGHRAFAIEIFHEEMRRLKKVHLGR